MRVFIVGATGVVGQPVVSGLTALGDEVVALVRSRERAGQILGQGVEVHEGDLLTIPQEQLTAILQGCDAAAHLATALRPGSPGLGTTNTNAALRISGTRRLLDSVLAAGVPRYVQQSIAIAYEDVGDRWLDETTPFFRPDDEVGPAGPVVQMEAMVAALDSEIVAWLILRGGSFVGLNTRQDQVMEALKGGTLRVPGDGGNWVSFIHADDYAAAVVAAIHSSARGEILNVTDEPVRNGDYLDRLAAILELPEPARDPDAALPRSYRCTNEKARQLLGWAPETGIWPKSTE